jgi:hypothetical protein
MQISVSSQASLLNTSNFFVFALYDASAPSVLLESQQPPKPYGNPIQISFTYNCLAGHIYIIKLWESPDNTPTGIVRNSFSQAVNSNVSSISVKLDEYLEADVTGGVTSGATSYVNTDWAGWDYSIERVGAGTMTPDDSGNTNPSYTKTVSGGFSLLQSGDTFQPDEKFVVRFIPQVFSVPESGVPSAIFSSGRIITDDETLTISDLNKALLIQSATTKIAITLPSLVSVADYSFIYIYSIGGSHYNAVINCPGTDKIKYGLFDNTLSQIILGQGEILKMFKANSKWNVENELPGVKTVGEVFYNYLGAQINALQLSGQLVLRAEYPRLWAYVQTLQTGSIVTDSAWLSTFNTVDGVNYYTYKGCFSSGDGSTNFRLPLITNFIRPITSRVPGSLELQTIQSHNHHITGSTQTNFGGFGYVPGVNLAGTEDGGYTDKTGDAETKPTNVGLPLMIRI